MALPKIYWGKLIAAIGLCQLAGLIGSIFTVSSISAWYVFLNKPSWNPPAWLFGPVWTILYTLMGISLYIVWTKGLKKPKIRTAVWWFLGQLLLNSAWSVIFFGQKNIALAFAEILILFISIVIVTVKFYKIDKTAGYLMIPYLAWVSFAAFLNYTIWRLNS